MPKVHILSPDVISKIAAGEVIERPASVIKELIENSLDAHTTSIELHLEDAGKKLIRLRDTGTGISREDIETLFQRHATSKIQTFDDLFDIHSLGFRGEALYSIAAVSDVVLRSFTMDDRRWTIDDKNHVRPSSFVPRPSSLVPHPSSPVPHPSSLVPHPSSPVPRPSSLIPRPSDQDSPTGWEIHIRGGKRISLKPTSHPSGTEIEVKELFFNTPARRKFLKSNLSEMNQILATFTPYTLLYPSCRFCLTHEDKTLIDLAPAEQLTDRVAAALNLDAKNLLTAEHAFPEKETVIRLILGDANIIRSRRDLQFIFVNGRPVQSKNLSFHMNEAYRLILPPQNFSFFSVYLEVPPDQVDVNIHPTKREVKIKDENTLCSLLRSMTESTLMGRSPARQIQTDAQSPARLPVGSTPAEKFSETLESPHDHSFTPRPTTEYTFPQQAASEQAMENLFGKPVRGVPKEDLRERLQHAKFVGIFVNKFLLLESGKTLLIVDQHAAQERITFERLIQQMDKGKIEVQQLLSPVLVRATVSEMIVWEEIQATLEELGFTTTQFDSTTIAVHSHPALIRDAERALRDLLAGENPARSDHETLARRACRASVMAGDPLDATRANYIRQELLSCRDPFTCPHGRPTLIELSESFLDKQFLRA